VPRDSDEETTESEESDQERQQVKTQPKSKTRIIQTVQSRPMAKPMPQKQEAVSLATESKNIEPVMEELWQQYNLAPPKDVETDIDEQGVQVYNRIQLNKQRKLEAKVAKDTDKHKSDLAWNRKKTSPCLVVFLALVFCSALVGWAVSKGTFQMGHGTFT